MAIQLNLLCHTSPAAIYPQFDPLVTIDRAAGGCIRIKDIASEMHCTIVASLAVDNAHFVIAQPPKCPKLGKIFGEMEPK